jgi:hypothetical protein
VRNPRPGPGVGATQGATRSRGTDEQRDLRERAVAWVERSCAEQGVPVKMTDPLALAEIAEILLSGREKRSSSER